MVLTRLNTGSPFGEDALVGSTNADSTGRKRRERTAVAAADTDLVMMEMADLQPVRF